MTQSNTLAVALPRLAVATALLLIAHPVSAQVNAEKLRKLIKNDGAAGELDASVTTRFGNIEGIGANLAGQIHGKDGPHSGFVYSKGDYARTNHVPTAASSFAHVRYNYELSPILWAEAFGQLQNDRFRRLRLRELLGVGPRVGLVQSDDFDLFAGVALMWQHELIDVAPGASDAPTTTYYRASAYVAVNVVVGPTTNLSSTTYVQPRLGDSKDVRVLSESSLAMELSKRVTAKLEAVIHYDSRPPTSVLGADAEIKNVISLSF